MMAYQFFVQKIDMLQKGLNPSSPRLRQTSCYVKRKRGALEKSWLILKNVILYKKATALWNSVLQTVIH